MNKYFHMNSDLFDQWMYMLLEEAYEWKKIGISNEYCNSISVPKYGLELINWNERSFRVLDEKKYTLFILRYQ